jgi:hypothetical protein
MASTAQASSTQTTDSIPAGVPDFVVKYGTIVAFSFSWSRDTAVLTFSPAPLVYIYSKERYMPSDISAQLAHTIPKVKSAPLPTNASIPTLTLENLHELNRFGNGGVDIYLTSKDDVTENPAWLDGIKPGPDGKIPNAKTCTVIVADKGNGTVDAFYIYFYAFNWGGVVLGDNLGKPSI